MLAPGENTSVLPIGVEEFEICLGVACIAQIVFAVCIQVDTRWEFGIADHRPGRGRCRCSCMRRSAGRSSVRPLRSGSTRPVSGTPSPSVSIGTMAAGLNRVKPTGILWSRKSSGIPMLVVPGVYQTLPKGCRLGNEYAVDGSKRTGAVNVVPGTSPRGKYSADCRSHPRRSRRLHCSV